MGLEEGLVARVLDGMMHLEVNGDTWDGLIDDVLTLYDAAEIDMGVVMATWMPSRESNELTERAWRRHPDRFVPFGHVRPIDDWVAELQRVTSELGWTGLKLHQGELRYGSADAGAVASRIAEVAVTLGVKVIKLHLEDYEWVRRLATDYGEVTWIVPHLGCYGEPVVSPSRELRRYCELAAELENVYLDTSGWARYFDLDLAVRWAGPGKVTFASDGFLYNPLVEKAKVEALALPGAHRVAPLSRAELEGIMGGTMSRILGLREE